MKDAGTPVTEYVSPDGRKWRRSQLFVTSYQNSNRPTTASLYPYYSVLRQQVQIFLNTEKIDHYEIVRIHDAINRRVSLKLFWQPEKPTGDR